MTSLLSEGVEWLNTQRVDHLSEVVVYSRSGLPPFELAATRGSSTQQVIDESGQSVEAESVDFLVSSTSLAVSGGFIYPMIGDRIQTTDSGGLITIFAVLDLAGQGCYRWADSRGLIYRIHTKMIQEDRGTPSIGQVYAGPV